MSIFNNLFNPDEEIISDKLNQAISDANNTTDNIHPQYLNLRDESAQILHKIQVRYLSAAINYMITHGMNSIVTPDDGSGFVPACGINNSRKLPVSCKYLKASFTYKKTVGGGGTYWIGDYTVYINGAQIYTLPLSFTATTDTVITLPNVDISSYGPSDILDVTISMPPAGGSYPGSIVTDALELKGVRIYITNS